MATQFSWNLIHAAAKIETTAGTAETLADADFDVRMRDISITPIMEPDDESSKFATGDHGEDAAIMGAQSATISMRTKVAWAGAVGTQPKWWKLMHGCGCKPSAYGVVGYALHPLKEYDSKTITIEVYALQKGAASPVAVKFIFAGCMGNAVINADGIGSVLNATFTFTGKFVDVVDVAYADLLELTSPDTTLAEKLLSTTVTAGGVTQRISSFSLDLGNEITPLIAQAQATGYSFFNIANRKPRLSFNPLMDTVATEDVWQNSLASVTKNILLDTTNFHLDVPVAQLMAPGVANREGHFNWDQTWRCLRNGTADSDIPDESAWELLIGARS